MPNNSTDTQHIQPVSVFVYPTLVQYTQNASESSQVLRPLQPSRWQRRWWLRAACMRLTILSIERLIRNRTSWLDFEVLPKKVQERYHVFMYIQYLNFMYIEIRHTFRFPQTKMFLGGAPNSKGANPGRYQWPTAQTWFRSRDSPDFSWQWSLLRRNSQKRTIKHCKSVVKPTWFYMYVCILHIDVILYTLYDLHTVYKGLFKWKGVILCSTAPSVHQQNHPGSIHFCVLQQLLCFSSPWYHALLC